MANTILLKGRGHRVEKVAAGAITPGHLVKMDSTGKLAVHNTALGAAARIFAVENDLVGKEITDAYAANDYVQAEHLGAGDEVLAFLKVAAPAVVIGDYLEAGGNGALQKQTTGIALAYALEAIDNSAGGTQVRIKVALL
jgi:hypothetical protein